MIARTLIFSLCIGSTGLASGLSDVSLLAEHLSGHRYDHLYSLLEKDASFLISRQTGKEKNPVSEEEMRLRLLLLSTLNQLPLADISDPTWTRQHKAFLDWLFMTPDMLAMLAAEIRPADNGKAVLETWAKLWSREQTPEFRTKYAALSLSLALIYDHPNGIPRAKEQYHPTLTLTERYEFFRDSSEKGKLDTPVNRMSVRDLVNTVDLNISRAEIDWAHRHANGPRKNAGQNYSQIEYLMERAVNGKNPYESYTLPEIKKYGGICGDQSHYSMNAAKARGIPAATIVGTGDRGPHAWLGFMPDENTWASFGSQGITNGRTFSSQLAKQVSFRHMHLESHEDYQPETRLPVLVKVELARAAIRKKEFKTASALLSEAKKLGKLNREIWETEKTLLLATAAGAEQWSLFIRETEKTFKDHAHVVEWAMGLKIEHLFAKLPEEERMKLLERQIRKVARDLGTEESALISVVDRVAKILVTQNSPDALSSLYRRSFRRYGEDLELFTKLMHSYARHGAKLPELRPRIPGELHTAYKRVVDSGSKEYFRADMELSVLQGIISIYERLGSEEDADKIAKLKKHYVSRKKKISRAAL